MAGQVALDEARSWYSRGIDATTAGRPQEARAALQTALDHLQNADDERDANVLQIRCQLNLASVDYDQFGFAAAASQLDRAFRQSTALQDQSLIALCYSQRATIRGRSGKLVEALADIDIALPQLEGLAPRDQSILLIAEGMICSQFGLLSRADRAFARADVVSTSAALQKHAFMARHNRGYVKYLANDLPAAIRLMNEADQLPCDVSRSVARLDHGRALLEAGLVDEAEAILRSGLSVSLIDGQQQVTAELEMEVARANLLLGRVPLATTAAGSALRRLRSRATEVWSVRCELLLLQIMAEETTSTSDLAARAARFATSADATGNLDLARDAHLVAARSYALAGFPSLAKQHVAKVDNLPTRILDGAPLSARLDHLYTSASIALALEGVDQAKELLRRASDQVLRDPVFAGSLDLRTSVPLHAVRLAALDMRLAREGAPSDILDSSERWRAVSLRVPRVRPSPDPGLADALAGLRRLENRARDTPGDGLGVAEVANARREVQRIARGLKATEIALADSNQHAALAEIQQALRLEDADLISVVDHESDVLAISLVAGALHVHRVGDLDTITRLARRVRSDLAMAASRELGALAGPVADSLRSGLSEIDGQLVQPADRQRRRLVMVASASTRALPWGMVPSLRGVPVTVAQSATHWTRKILRSEQSGSGQPIEDTRGDRPTVTVVAGPGLVHAEAEAVAVAGYWPGARILRGEEARIDDVRHALATSDIVHIAAHGTHERQNPMFASIRLTDGSLYVHDLELQGVQAKHVVLSACDVGASIARPGEESLGLAAGMLALGATSVVAALCRVADEVTAEVMAAYHRRISAGELPDVALTTVARQRPDGAGAFGLYGVGRLR